MKTRKLLSFAICVFGLVFIGCGDKDTIHNENEDKTKNGNSTLNEINVENEQMLLLNGTWWKDNSSSIFIEFSGNYILFRNRQNYGSIGGNLNGDVTHGGFQISSYDGNTMKILDYDNKEVAFTLIISENKMTVDRLNAIKWTAPPYEPRYFASWNGTYAKGAK